MKHPIHKSVLAAALAWLCLPSCSTVPDWSKREVREHRITAVYDAGDQATTVRLPTSNEQLLILDLQVESDQAREIFTANERRLHLPSGLRNVKVNCRYRLFREPDPSADPAPWPTPESLFPGATRVDQHN